VIGFVLKVTAGFIVAYTSNSNLIGGFITAGLFLVIVGWQTACYVVLSKRWTSVRSRLLAGFAVALLFAILPYFGLLMATAPLKNNISCRLPDSKGSYACHAFGSYVGSADYNPMVNAGQLGWLFLIGAPLALGMFALYAVFVVVEGRSANRTANSA
jgi:hypothetical protein